MVVVSADIWVAVGVAGVALELEMVMWGVFAGLLAVVETEAEVPPEMVS